ncbi:hypothetical protein SADUNF_Sadunf15G0083500 [Salix dunnii]|uniref:Cytochrome P450 n=1 Tax=Salix dunnii TaxID=1413687 RepID=A0A835JE59_9ROSI|nr:hypothetical protein SADUNF_Sadunf15G0083500 [Salix dunnii]
MDILLLILVSLAVSAFLKAFFFDSKTIIHNQLPPGPRTFPLIGNVFWLYTPFSKFESHIRSLHAKFGPIITIHFVSRPFITVADRFIAYKALIQNGATFADRPGAIAAARVLDKSQNSISSSFYGPTLRLLRGNLATGIFHPSRVKSHAHAHARKRVLQTLQNRLELLSKSGEPIQVLEHLRLAMYSLLAHLCFGDKLSQKQIEEIEEVEHRATLHLGNISIFHFWKSFSKIVLRKRRAWSLKIRKDQEDVFIPLIRARKEERSTKSNMEDQDHVLSYVDTLLDLRFPANHDKRKLTERDILSFCNEFLNAGAGTTTTALEWILANLVKYPEIQEKLFMEIKGVVRDGDQGVKEDDLQEMQYLKAIILEGLRRHPPSHYSLPHAVTDDTTLNEYLVPKNGTVVFMLADIGWDPNSWEDPMAFKPERFLSSSSGGDAFDITGSREIKMMPFGAGRRMCPGYGFAMLILEYFVANLIWSFEWKAVDGDGVDLSEKQEFTVVMKNPLQAQISPRWKNN